MEITEGSGFTGNYASMCTYCNKELIEYDQLMQFNKDLANQRDKQNIWSSIMNSSLFTYNLSGARANNED